MRLEEYLERLQTCPDEQLKDELGVYDNWPIFLREKFTSVVGHLKRSDTYALRRVTRGHDGIILFDYVPGTVEVQVFNYVPPSITTGCGMSDWDKHKKRESEKQLREYTTTLMLHPYQKRKMEGVHSSRALAEVIENIGKFVIENSIPACMPNSIGWKHRWDGDYSRIVYHQPEKSSCM